MLESLDILIAFAVIMLVVSLLITIAVQMAAAAFNLRGLNLLSSLGNAFAAIAPSLETKRDELARYILKGRLFSDSFLPAWMSWWRHASAIRPDEMFDAIHRIAIGKEVATDELRSDARTLLIALGANPEVIGNVQQRITNAQGEIKQLQAEGDKLIANLPEEARAQLKPAVDNAIAAVGDKLKEASNVTAVKLAAAAGTVDSAYEKFQYWFCASEERAQQWMAMHTRIITIFFAFFAALGLQLDAVEIFKLVSSNKPLRDNLTARSTALASQAEKVFRDNNTVLQQAFITWKGKYENDATVKAAFASFPIEANYTRETVVTEIRRRLGSAPNTNAYLDSFNHILDETALDRLKKQAGDYSAVKADFDNSGFELFPKSDQGRWGNGWGTLGLPGARGHYLGILFSVALLSLGAPFWYNSLKNLTNLRSAVAQNISEEKQKPPQSSAVVVSNVEPPTTSQAPPTVK